MRMRSRLRAVGLGLGVGGAVAAVAAVTVPGIAQSLQPATFLVFVGCAGLGTVLLLAARRSAATLPDVSADRSDQPEASVADERTGPGGGVSRRAVAAFLTWIQERDDAHADIWPAFDQFLRDLLAEHAGASRIRCFHVGPHGNELRSLAIRHATDPPDTTTHCTGVLRHVAVTGEPFVAGAPFGGELLEELASEDATRWDWVWAVRPHGRAVGLVAVGQLPPVAMVDRELRHGLIDVVGLFWEHVSALESERDARRTDRGSGVLNRAEFIRLAGSTLRDAYAAGEPVVLATVSVEGIRSLDDRGLWAQRDALIEDVGHLLTSRVRTDDLIGRFSDERFVILLRRLDVDLGRLIMEKVLASAHERLADVAELHSRLAIRAGLAGSGMGRTPFDTLLGAAFEAVDSARGEGVSLRCICVAQDVEVVLQ